MVIDTSAILAILFDEPERRRFNELIEADGTRLISAATFLEAALDWISTENHSPKDWPVFLDPGRSSI